MSASVTVSHDSMDDYAVCMYAHHPYGYAMAKRQCVTAPLLGQFFS